MGSHSLFQGIFLTQGSNLDLLQLQADSLLSESPGKPEVLIYEMIYYRLKMNSFMLKMYIIHPKPTTKINYS